MDPLSDILTLTRPSGYGFRGLDTAGDWALDFAAAHGIKCFAIETGGCWLRYPDAPSPLRLEAGDVVLIAGTEDVRLYSSNAAHPVDSLEVLLQVPPGHVATINGGGECRGIGGFFGLEGPNLGGWLTVLPPIVHVRSDTSQAAIFAGVQRIMCELTEPRLGSELLAHHLAQALLVEALRAHLENGASTRGWLAGLSVPTLRRALTAMHADVARRWTLGELATTAGMSRSSFATHFDRVVGETPMAYLTRWRMVLAADRLARSAMRLADIAASVGYESESAFGAAFKRIMNRSPLEHRRHGG